MPQTQRKSANASPEQITSRLSYDSRANRYRNRNGQFVSRTTLRQEAERITKDISTRLTTLTEQLRDGQISLPEWTVTFRNEIKAGHSLAYTLAKGGRAQMSAADWGRVGNLTRFHLEALNRFSSQIENGGLLNFSRVRMYAAAVRNSFENAERRLRLMDNQMPYAQWVRNAQESCEGCIEQSNRGVQPLDEFPPIGSQDCGAFCKCELDITPNPFGL